MFLSGEGDGTPLQYSCLQNPMDGGAWWAAVHGVVKSQTRLSNFTFPFHFHALEKAMATHSSVLAWRIPGTAEPGGLPCMGSHRVGHNWSDLAAAAAACSYLSQFLWQFLSWVNILVCKSCHNNGPQTGCFKQQRLIFSQFFMLQVQDQGVDFFWGLSQ